MLKKCTVISLVILSWAVWGVTSHAQGPRPDPIGKWWQSPQISRQLGLKPGEQNRLNELFLEMRRSHLDLRSEVEKARLELDALTEKQTLDDKAAQIQIKRLEQAKAGIISERYRFLMEARKVLGPERYRKLKQIFNEYRHRDRALRKKPRP